MHVKKKSPDWLVNKQTNKREDLKVTCSHCNLFYSILTLTHFLFDFLKEKHTQ